MRFASAIATTFTGLRSSIRSSQSGVASEAAARRPRRALERCAKNLNHVTLPEIKDFNALHDARCFRYFVKRYNPGHGTRIA